MKINHTQDVTAEDPSLVVSKNNIKSSLKLNSEASPTILEDPTFILEKNDSKFANKSVYLSSVYNSEEEKMKQENFERNLEDLSDDRYFNRMKDEKNSPFSRANTQKSEPECDYQEMADLKTAEKWKRKKIRSFFRFFSKGAIVPTVFLLLSSTIGAGFLLDNTYFQKNPLPFSIFSYLICSILSHFSSLLLVESCHACKRYSFAGLSEALELNCFFVFLIKMVFFLFNLSVIVIYTSMMGNIIAAFFDVITHEAVFPPDYTHWHYIIMIVSIMAVMIFPMSVFRQFYNLWIGCMIGNMLLVAMIILMIILTSLDVDHRKHSAENWNGRFNDLVLPVFAFSCQNVVPDIFQEIKGSSRKRMGKALTFSTLISLTMYVLMGMFCFIDNDSEDVQKYLKSHYRSNSIRIAVFIFALYLIFIIPINMKPCKESLLYIISPESGRDSRLTHVLLTAFCGSLAIAISIVREAMIVVYKCSTVITAFVCFMFPAIFYIRIVLKKEKSIWRNAILVIVFIIIIPLLGIFGCLQSFLDIRIN